MTKIAVVDIETSGLDIIKHEIIEVGYVLMDDQGRKEYKEFALKFDIPSADPKALEVNGYGKRAFPGVLNRYHAAQQLCDDFKGRTIVASPAVFDVAWISAWLNRLGFSPTWSHRAVIDLKSYFLGVTGYTRALEIGNKDMSEYLNVTVPTSDTLHTALVDAEWTARMFERCRAHA